MKEPNFPTSSGLLFPVTNLGQNVIQQEREEQDRQALRKRLRQIVCTSTTKPGHPGVYVLGPHEVKALLSHGAKPADFERAEWMAYMGFELREDIMIGLAEMIVRREKRDTPEALLQREEGQLSPLALRLLEAMAPLGREPTIERVASKAGIFVVTNQCEKISAMERFSACCFATHAEVIEAFNDLVEAGLVIRGVKDKDRGVSLTHRSPVTRAVQ
jgi:hypothetical protein